MKRRYVSAVLILILGAALYADDCQQEMAAHMEHGSEMSFHGKRMSRDHEAFFITSIAVRGRLLFVRFNMPVDPRTLTAQNVQMNGSALPDNTRIRYNKSGISAEITLSEPCSSETAFTFTGVTSFDGTALVKTDFSGIINGCHFQYAKPELPKKKPDAAYKKEYDEEAENGEH